MSIHLERGKKDDIAFVFSCPGRREQEECRPAAGDTGRNLEDVLCFMRQRNSTLETLVADDWTRENIWVTNAWPYVEFRGCTDRTEASVREILCETNISRLNRELENIRCVIVCCGKRAERVVDCLRDRETLQNTVKVVSLCHLSNLALNGWIRNSAVYMQNINTSGERRRERLRRWADYLYQKIE